MSNASKSPGQFLLKGATSLPRATGSSTASRSPVAVTPVATKIALLNTDAPSCSDNGKTRHRGSDSYLLFEQQTSGKGDAGARHEVLGQQMSELITYTRPHADIVQR